MSLELPDADALLIVPPLAHLSWPSLGVHALQAAAREAGFRVAIFYANLALAARIGDVPYSRLCNAPTEWLLGERLFARAAHGLDGLASARFRETLARHNDGAPPGADRYLDQLSDATGGTWRGAGTAAIPLDDLVRFEEVATRLADELAAAIAMKRYRLVGATTTFDQTNAAIALLARVKRLAKETVTAIGGANTDGAMARGVRAIADADVVVSGEGDLAFPALLRALARGERPAPIVAAEPVRDMDALATPDYSDYWEQLARFVPSLSEGPVWVAYETSRGCWWGEKHHCTFCGLNGTTMAFRGKSADRVARDLREILARAPTRFVCMTDNIMPHEFHRTLLPRLASERLGAHLFYEIKANLTLDQVKGLLDGGVRTVQPGIEALNSRLLALMDKGVLARQNVALLRYARAVGLAVKWNLLWGFPGDDAAIYEETRALVPLLHHLVPPNALVHLQIDRFSPYHERAAAHGVSAIEPLEGYGDVFPRESTSLAYHFTARYRAGSHDAPELMAALWREVESWKDAWAVPEERIPVLHVVPAGAGRFTLHDTRAIASAPVFDLDEAQAAAVLVGGPLGRVALADWAIRNRFAVALDGWCAPLATAPYGVLAELEKKHATSDARDGAPLQVLRTIKPLAK